jgi:hypothetical protein
MLWHYHEPLLEFVKPYCFRAIPGIFIGLINQKIFSVLGRLSEARLPGSESGLAIRRGVVLIQLGLQGCTPSF